MVGLPNPTDATVYTILPQDVLVEERQRKTARNRKDFEEFKASIAKFGQLQPGICRRDSDGLPILIIGEGRLTACRELGIEFSYILKEDIKSEADLYEIELIENIRREDLNFKDRCEAILRLHELRQKEKGATRPGAAGGHGVRDTAEELHLSVGSTQEDIKIAMYARDIAEVAQAPNRTTARKIIKRIEEELIREELLDEAIREADEAEAQVNGPGSEGQASPDSGDGPSPEQRRLMEYNERCFLGTMENTLQDLPVEEFDVVCFDPPWGVDLEKVALNSGNTKSYDDDATKVKDLFPTWIRLIYSKMSQDSHLYLFFGIVHHEYVYSELEAVGFVTNRMPIIWHKKGSHRTRAPEVWPGRSYEAIAYARKGSKRLAKYGEPDIISTPVPTPKMKKNHPSAKHPNVYRDLLIRSCSPGDKVLDPMAGSGMFAVAAESLRKALRLNWYQIEKDQDYLTTQLWNLSLGYHGVLGQKDPEESQSGPSFTPPPRGPASANPQAQLLAPPEDFRTLTPGTEMWKLCWESASPEKQTEMLEWKKSQN